MLYTLLFVLTLFCLGFGSDAHPIIFLKQSHFATGSLRITKPGKYILCEDIVFNPRRNLDDPNCEGAYYPMETEADLYPGADYVSGAFRLGFFAAIVVESNNVIIDLNRKEIKMAAEFRLQQRFFANIEIGAAPFIQGQGPAKFGNFLSPDSGVSNVTITNGRLGLSSHHGIHGNAARNVVLSNLKVYDFEVGGIQMNHFSNLIIRNVEVGPSAINVPVTAFWGSARFDLLNFRILRDTHGDQVVNFANRMHSKTVEDIVDDLQLTMDILVDKFVAGELYEFNSHGITDDSPNRQEVYDELFKHSLPIFVNKEGLPDGASMYGIILNSRGGAIQWFGRAKSRSQDVVIENVKIHDLNNKVLEFGAYRDSNGSTNTGPYREIFNMFAILDIGRESLNSVHDVAWRNLGYRGNVLSDAQIALAIYGEENTEKGKVKTKISAEVIDWVTKGVALPSAGQLVCNGDVMFHAIKGVMGLRIDNVDRASVNNVQISYINNWGELGHYLCKDQNGNYISHPTIPTNHYEGTAARAITITNSSVSLGNIRIHNIASANGNSYGLEVLDDVSNVEIVSDIYIDHVFAGNCLTQADLGRMNDDPIPNPVPMACAFTAIHSGTDYLHTRDIIGPAMCT